MAEKPLELEHVRYMFVIDDDEIQREMIKDYMMERYLFTIKTYDNGEDAYSDIKALKPEIVILDYYLNSHNANAANGLDVLKEIKTTSPITEVVMFTGEDKLDVALGSMRNGAFDYVVKGESAFNKIENVINTLGERHKALVIQSAQKRTISFLIGVICLILTGALIYFFKSKE